MTKTFAGLIAAAEATKDMDETKVIGPLQESFFQQYRLTDIERERIANEFLLFCYSVTKTMLTENTTRLPNRTGRLLTSVIPMDKEMQKGIIEGSTVNKTSFSTGLEEYPRTKDWDPIMLPIIRGFLDPLYGGVIALKDYGVDRVPKVGLERENDRESVIINLSRPMMLEMVARMQVSMPWGESPYGEQLPAYRMVLGFLQIFPSLLVRAAQDPLSVTGVTGALRNIENMCYGRLNG